MPIHRASRSATQVQTHDCGLRETALTTGTPARGGVSLGRSRLLTSSSWMLLNIGLVLRHISLLFSCQPARQRNLSIHVSVRSFPTPCEQPIHYDGVSLRVGPVRSLAVAWTRLCSAYIFQTHLKSSPRCSFEPNTLTVMSKERRVQEADRPSSHIQEHGFCSHPIPFIDLSPLQSCAAHLTTGCLYAKFDA
ncbi:unnamed protein product [Cyclocybe aegerita]|uniref:Uncharacterized protein n=1 Tax=Cyclocybe aegerita TaxID=1973307 RepID=A0A8S0WBG4_CYCAE|nr:unnamed protein product [Cyclocybe aegerita]